MLSSAFCGELLPFLRAAAALTLLLSAVSLVRLRRVLHTDFGPHIVFVAGWSLVNSVLMFMLSFHIETLVVFQALNGATVCLIGGWATLVMRISSRLQAASSRVKETNEP